MGKTNRQSGRATECVKRTPLSKQGPHRGRTHNNPSRTHTYTHTHSGDDSGEFNNLGAII